MSLSNDCAMGGCVDNVLLDNLPKLTSVSFGHIEKFKISRSPNVEQLTLNGIDSAASFRLIGQASKLRHLSINSIQFSDPEAFQAIGNLPELETLRIMGNGVADESLAMLDGFPKLKSIYIPDGVFSAVGLRHLKTLKYLEEITLGEVGDEGEPLACLNELPRLRRLEIIKGDIGLLKLSGLMQFNGLRVMANYGTLHLQDLPLLGSLRLDEKQQIHRLALIDLPVLDEVVVYPNKKQLLEHVSLRELPRLTEINIRSARPNKQLTDECFRHLASFRNLEDLNLDNSRVTEETLEQLAQLPQLRQVSLYNTPLNEAAIDRLKSNTAAEKLSLYWRIDPSSGLDEHGEFKK
ncbi:MAG: Leucine-rich repeat (LRR) protein [Pirellulaceae bacterium]|jgi:Leucine-rich repeat (LRR) protein